jgi:Kef-type K+ transport system membrane component KefB
MSTAALAPFHPMLYVGLLLLLSFLGGRIANRLRFPRVTGYLVAGILLGPSVAGVFPATVVQQDLGFITSMALAVIAFSIGGSLHLGRLKRVGGQILWVTLAEASGAFLLTTLVLTLGLPVIQGAGFFSLQQVKVYFPIALLIGSLCAATAPAAVLAIVHEYRSQGPLTVFLLGVVALDDGAALIFFSFAMSLATGLLQQGSAHWQEMLFAPLASLFLALLLGGAVGLLLRVILPLISRREALIGVALGGILLAGGLALSLKLPFLLTNMVLGFTVINFVGRHEELFTAVEGIEEPIFGMFFLLAGAHFDFNLMRLAGGLALLITLSRFLGKFLGVWCGARLCAAPAVVGRYLSLGLSPQAGVAVGLVLEAQILLGNTEIGDIVVSGVLGAVILNELLTPPFVRMALLKAKEAVLPP